MLAAHCLRQRDAVKITAKGAAIKNLLGQSSYPLPPYLYSTLQLERTNRVVKIMIAQYVEKRHRE